MNTPEKNKELVLKYIEALSNNDLKSAGSYFHPDFTFYSQVDTPHHGFEGFVEAEGEGFAAFSNLSMTPMWVIAEDDEVAALVLMEADHTEGRHFGMAPKGAHVRQSIGMFFTMKDGLICEKRGHYDRAAFWEQEGAKGLSDYIESL